MRIALALLVLLSVAHPSAADMPEFGRPKVRFADAATDACLSSCESQNAACKRVCPTTLSTPCVMSCDSQAQTCRAGCRRR